MKIAIFSDTFPPQTNGVANVAYQTAKKIAELGHEVMVFTVGKKLEINPDISGLINLKIVKLLSVPAMIYHGERIALPLGVSVFHLKKFKPDVIHSHTPFPAGWEAVMASKILKIPLVGTHHTFYDHYLKHVKLDFDWMKKFSWKCTVTYYNFCKLVISPSQVLADTLIEKGLKSPVEVLRNSIDTSLFRPVGDQKTKKEIKKRFGIEGKSVVYMGRLSYEKNIDQIIRAFAIMLEKISNLKLMLIGDGPERKKLEKLAEDLKIKDKIIFTGFLRGNNLVEALRANDVFLSASKSENMPLSVLEAMATGLPLILVPEKGLAELVHEGINGFFSRTDNPRDMAEKTAALLSNQKLLSKLSKGSRLSAMNYDEEKIANLLIELYKKIK